MGNSLFVLYPRCARTNIVKKPMLYIYILITEKIKNIHVCITVSV